MRFTKKKARLILANIGKGSILEKYHWVLAFHLLKRKGRWIILGPYINISNAQKAGEDKLELKDFVIVHLNTRDSRNAREEIRRRMDKAIIKLFWESFER